MLGYAKRKLERNDYIVFTAENLADATTFLHNNKPDLIILDVMLPDGNGFNFCRHIRQKSSVPVLFITGKTTINDKIEGLSTGADYYLTKPYDLDELVAVSKMLISRNKREINVDTLRFGDLTLDPIKHIVTANGELLSLTPKEFSILHSLIKAGGDAISAEVIYSDAWETPWMNSDNQALKMQLSRLRKKLCKYTSVEIINDKANGYYLEY